MPSIQTWPAWQFTLSRFNFGTFEAMQWSVGVLRNFGHSLDVAWDGQASRYPTYSRDGRRRQVNAWLQADD